MMTLDFAPDATEASVYRVDVSGRRLHWSPAVESAERERIGLPRGSRRRFVWHVYYQRHLDPQAYFWSPAWFEWEDAATEDIEQGRVHTFEDVDDAIRFLHGERQ